MVDYAEIQERSVDAFKQELLDLWATLELTDPLHFGEGSVPGLIYEAIPRIANRFSRMAVASKVLTLGEDATGEALTLWSRSVYGHERNPSIAAVWNETLTCAAGSGPYTLDVGSVVVASGDFTFRLSAPPVGETWPVTLSSAAPKTFQVTCEQPGSGGTVGVGTITRMVTTYLGVTCTNTSLITSGVNEESDAVLRTRNRTIWATRNPLSLVADAYVYYAMQAHPEVKRVRVIDDNPRGMYSVDVVLAGESSTVQNSTVTTVSVAFSGKLLAPFYARLSVYKATETPLNLAGPVYYYSGFNLSAVQGAIATALTTLASEIPIGGAYYPGYGDNVVLRAQIEKAIEGAKVGDQPCVKLAPLSYPAAFTTLLSNQVATLTPAFNPSALNLIAVTS
jgi:uncharacterized phage protein gp47/JayE